MRVPIILIAAVLVSFCFVSADDSKDAAAAATTVIPGFSESDVEYIKQKEEKYEFQAEVSRLMDIIINSLYSNREIFLRELISNASDALDKIRFKSLTDKAELGEGALADLDIRISFDKKAKTLTITDKGVGMSKEELIKNLGIVANSGTTQFLQAAGKGGAEPLQLIGQFGVGFYSVYLVADRVTVASKSNASDKQFVWMSAADKTFTVVEDPRGNTLGRGTSVTLHLKEDAEEFLDQAALERIASKYSEFINFPIYLQVTKTESKEVPVEEEAKEEEKKEGEDVEVKDEEDDKKEEKKKTKTVTEEVQSWKLLNEQKAIWTRNPADVTPKEYEEFYKALTKDYGGFLDHVHFSAEGEIAFKSILYIPKTAAYDLYDKYYGKSTSLKLYVRRVLISDEFEDFMPRYLSFIKGVVDSDDLPLNVGRETLAKSKVLKVMGKKLTRKALQMLQDLAKEEEKEVEEAKKKAEEKKEGEEKEGEEKKEEEKPKKRFTEFYGQFGKSVKLGIIEDSSNKAKLAKLLRYPTTKSETGISLQEYVDRMKEKQDVIYYITGESMDAVKSSPFLERLKQRNLEVVYMTDPLDEYVVTQLQDFEGKKLMSVTKEGLQLPEDGDEKKKEAAYEKKYESFCKWLKTTLGDKVEKVKVSNRIAESPAVLVTGQFGWSANMERIMKAQTFSDPSKQQYMVSKKTLEINPRHPLIKEMRERSEANPDEEGLKDLATLMYDSALVSSGFTIDQAKDFSSRIQRVMAAGLKVDPNAPVEDDADLDLSGSDDATSDATSSDADSSSSSDAAGDDDKDHDEL